jgi:plasmid stabilization system protein ParE
VAQTLYDGCESLSTMPYRGRSGRRPNTRELVFPDLPYIAVYRIVEDVADILHFYHGAQDRR